MPSLQQIEKIASRLERYSTYKTLQAQANARYILYGVHEDEANFPQFDQRLTFRSENVAYICLEVACTYYNNQRHESASTYFNKGAQLLEYNFANSQTEIPERGFNLMICGLAYYCASQYSKAFVVISKGRYDGFINRIIYAFLNRRFKLLENEIKNVLLEEEHKEEITPYDILLARAFSLVLNYFYYGNQRYLDESIEILRDATELALLEVDAEVWWLFRLLTIVFDGFNDSSLWKNLHNHPMFTVDDNGWRAVWEWLGMPEKDWDASAKEKLELYIHSQTFKKAPITELFVSQRNALQKVLMEESSVVSMPTSSGKTRIAEIVILQSLLRDTSSKVLYIAPYRSLASEVEETLTNAFDPMGFKVTHLYGGAQITALDRNEMETARVMIATPEKAKAILRINDEEMNSIKLVVMDEGHLLRPKPREIANEMFTEELRRIVKQNRGKFLLLSAVLPNANDISQWLSGKQDNVVHDTWRPSSQRIGLMCYRGNRIDIEWQGEVSCFNSGFVKTNGDKKQSIAEAAIKLSELGAVLIYITRPDWVLPNARTMFRLIKDYPDIDWGDDDLDWKRFNLVCQELEEDREYIDLAKKGILCHSAKMKVDVRRYMERLLRKGKARFIYATNTLAQGVNLGVSTLIVTNTVLGRGTYLSTNDFWNMAGRAGRSYIDTEGKILFVCDCTRDEKKSRRQAARYMDKIATDKAISGVYVYLSKLCAIQWETDIDFNQLLELIAENQLDRLPQEEDGDLSWNAFFELIDDSLLTLDQAYRDSDSDDVQWVDEHFKNSLAVIQEEDEALRSQHLEIIKARVHAVRRFVNGEVMPRAFASSGIPLKAAIYLDEKADELMRIAEEYLNSSHKFDDKLYFFHQFDQIAQDIPSERINVPDMDVLGGIRVDWFSGEPMNYNEVSFAESYYGNTVSWLLNALVSRFSEVDEDRIKECYEEMSLMASYGVPSRWAARLYLCGINSRKVATELSFLLDEIDSSSTKYAVAKYVRQNANELLINEKCSDLAKAWLEVFNTRPPMTKREIKYVRNFHFKKDETDIPSFLICKKTSKSAYLCSVDLKYKRSVTDTERLPFSDVADVPGVFFTRDGDVWRMKNVNPYVSVAEE